MIYGEEDLLPNGVTLKMSPFCYNTNDGRFRDGKMSINGVVVCHVKDANGSMSVTRHLTSYKDVVEKIISDYNVKVREFRNARYLECVEKGRLHEAKRLNEANKAVEGFLSK